MDSYSIINYLKYILFSSHRRGHGIHSPFVYRLIAEVLRNKIDTDIVLSIEKRRKLLIADNRKIKVKDYGAGSKKMKGEERYISDIAKYSSLPRKYGVLLAGLAGEFGGPGILELGTSLGISTMYLASGSAGSLVHSAEGCSSTYAAALENVSQSGYDNIRLYNMKFDGFLESFINSNLRPGLVFIDGDHRKEPLLRYFEMILDISTNDTVIVIDDIHSSAEMGETWNTIKKNGRISLTIDLRRLGLVFFREGMTRTDLIIRY